MTYCNLCKNDTSPIYVDRYSATSLEICPCCGRSRLIVYRQTVEQTPWDTSGEEEVAIKSVPVRLNLSLYMRIASLAKASGKNVEEFITGIVNKEDTSNG